MTDDNNTDNNSKRTSGRRQRPRWFLMGIAGALALVIGGMTWSAVAYSGKSWDSDKIERFVEWKIDDMLAEVDATDDQRTQVHAIATAALADMEEFRNFKREGRAGARRSAHPGDRGPRGARNAAPEQAGDRRPCEPAPAHGACRRGRRADPRPAQGAGGGTGVAPLASRARLSAPAPDGAEGAEGAVRQLPPHGVRPWQAGTGAQASRLRARPLRPAISGYGAHPV